MGAEDLSWNPQLCRLVDPVAQGYGQVEVEVAKDQKQLRR